MAYAVLPLLLAHLALLVTFDLAKRPYLTIFFLAAAFLSYWRATQRLESQVTASTLLLVAVLLRLLMLPLPPTLSDDTLRYVWDGRVVNAGFNPYLLAPEAPELEPLRDELWQQMPHQEVQTVYPPLALALFSSATWLPRPLLGVKILLCFVELVGCWLLILLARRLQLPDGRAAWYCWNPLVTLEVAGMGHVDAMVVTAMVASVLLFGDTLRRTAFAGAAAAAGVLAKLVPLIAFPLWARHSGRPMAFLAAALGLVACAMLPVAVSVGGVPPGLVTYGISWEFNGPLYEPLWRLFDRVELADRVKGGLDLLKHWTGFHDLWNRFYPFVYPQLLAKILLAGVFGICVLINLRAGHPVIGSGRLFGCLVLCAATVYPWYLLWVLPWAALARHHAWLALSASITICYLPQTLELPLFPWFYLAIWVPFFALLISSKWNLEPQTIV
ncbi:MAG: glycosyltransferase 87 family protein [Acidobacteriota bacterium]